MYWFVGKDVKNSIDIMVEATAVCTIEFTCLESCNSSCGMVGGVTENFGPFCSKKFSSGVSSFLERLIIHLSWILEEAEEVTTVLKVFVVLEAILEVVVEDLEKRCLSFLIWVFLYCRNVFSLLLKITFIRSVKVVSSSFCCRDILVLTISVWRWLILIFVHLILFWMSEFSGFFIMACSNILPFHLICNVFGVTLFVRHLRLKIIEVLDLASCISSFSNFLEIQFAIVLFPNPRGHLLHLVFQHKRQLTHLTFLISIYNRSVIPMFTPFKLQDN